MDGTIIIFRLKPPQDPNMASLLVKKLYGQKTSSHKGKYHYRRKGLLDEIPAHRLIRGVIIVREKDSEKVISFLEGYDTEIFSRRVELAPDDVKLLEMK
ncbi:MAG: hypothetical protein ABXS91_11070 [Sulfurimonas sp.]